MENAAAFSETLCILTDLNDLLTTVKLDTSIRINILGLFPS